MIYCSKMDVLTLPTLRWLEEVRTLMDFASNFFVNYKYSRDKLVKLGIASGKDSENCTTLKCMLQFRLLYIHDACDVMTLKLTIGSFQDLDQMRGGKVSLYIDQFEGVFHKFCYQESGPNM
jgi:hypothetical protein